MVLTPLLDDFLRHIEHERNLSSHTTSQYASDLKHWLADLESRQVPLDTDAITVPVMRQWMQDLSEAGRRPPTITRKLCCLRSFWKFIRRYHAIEHDPMSTLITPKHDKRLPEVMKRSEIMRVFQACDQSHYRFHRVRDRAIIAVLACLGLRRQELIDIRVEDLDFEAKTLLVRTAKRGRERLVPLTDELIAMITNWLAIRPDCETPQLFLSRHGTSLSVNGLGDMLLRLTKHGDLERRPKLHMFRHYAGTAMVQQSGIEKARRLLGHQSPETTAIYSHLSVDDLRPAINETAALSGISHPNGVTDTTIQLDGTTEMALQRLEQAMQRLPAGWRQRDAVLRHLTTMWAAAAASGKDVAFPVEVVEKVLWERTTVPGLSFDEHILISNFGNVVVRYLIACERESPRIDRVRTIGEELGHGIPGRKFTGEGLDEGQLTKLEGMLSLTVPASGLVSTLLRAARLGAALESFRADIVQGQSAIELLLGLTTWGEGYPPLIIPAADKYLWRLLLQRLLAGDPLPLVAYGVARLRGMADGVHAVVETG